MDDQVYDDTLTFLKSTTKKYPVWIYKLNNKIERQQEKSKFRQRVKRYAYENGKLMYQGKEVLKRSSLPGALKIFHDNPATGGHYGRDKTYAKLAERYYWKGMKKDICTYIESCEKCFMINPKIASEEAPLHPIPVPNKVSFS